MLYLKQNFTLNITINKIDGHTTLEFSKHFIFAMCFLVHVIRAAIYNKLIELWTL